MFPDNNCSFILTVKPLTETRKNIGRIFSLCNENGVSYFFVGQWGRDLIIRVFTKEGDARTKFIETGAENVFIKGIVSNIEIVSGTEGFEIIVNGKVVIRSNRLSLVKWDGLQFAVLGNSPSGSNQWEGELLNLRFFDGIKNNRTIAWNVSFKEGKGNVIHGNGRVEQSLRIHDKFAPIKRVFLANPWNNGGRLRYLYKDMAINILGFIPVGYSIYCVCKNYFRSRFFMLGATILLCFAVSILIELLQVFIPERTSSLLDALLNISGGILGIFIGKQIVSVFARCNYSEIKD
jgi:hypothetical protein